MSFEVRTEFGNLDPEAKRALVAMQHAIRSHLDDVDRRARRPKRQVTEVVEEGGVVAKPGQVVRVRPGDEDVQVVLPTPDAGNGGEDIIVSFEGDGTATGKVLVTPANSTCDNPGTTTLNTPGTYRFTSTGAPGEQPDEQGSTWGGPAPLSLDDLPEVGANKVLGNNTGAPATPIELSASQVLDLVGSTRGSVLERGASGWTAVTPGTAEFPIVSKGAGADPVYQQLATAGIADDAVTNAKLANMATAKLKGRTTTGTGDPEDLTPANSTSNTWNTATGGSISVERAALTGFAAASANSNATTSAEPIVTYSASANMSAERVLTSSTSNTISTAVSGQIAVQRAALTGEVTASADANATTVTRSTDFQTTPWTGNHQFNGEIRGGTITSVSSSGAINVTLTAGSTRLNLSSSSTITLGTISGCADGRILFVEHSNSGRLNVTHDSGSADAIACPGDVDFHMNGRGGFILVGRLATNANWKMIEPEGSGRLLRVQDLSGSGTYTPSSDCGSFYVEMWGGGGGGGGAVGSVGNSAVGAGGGGGGYCSFYVTTLSTYAYSVGGGGSAGSSAGGDGGTGSNTTFDTASANGGVGGEGSAHATRGSGAGTTFGMTGTGGVGGNGNSTAPSGGTVLNFGRGFPGMPGFRQSATVGWGGGGGSAGGGKGPTGGWNTSSSSAGGSGSNASGSGGDGGFSISATGRAGGSGGSGRIRVWEYS